MNFLGNEFDKHFILIKENEISYTFKCKATDKSFILYKCKLPQKYMTCRFCGEKIEISNPDLLDDVTKKYLKLLDSYLNSNNKDERKKLQIQTHYYRKKANIPYADYKIIICQNNIDLLNARILEAEEIKDIDKQKYNCKLSCNRSLFLKIKETIPDFTEYTKFSDYKKYVLKEQKGEQENDESRDIG